MKRFRIPKKTKKSIIEHLANALIDFFIGLLLILIAKYLE